MKRGFTLIELLVVVLIIGVLTAIALPQYQIAVDKSRYATLMPMAKSVASAQEAFYMNGGHYSDDLAYLDVQLPNDPSGTVADVGDGLKVEISEDSDYGFVKMSKEGLENNYIIYQDNSLNYPKEIHCEALTGSERAERLCKTLGGSFINGSLTDGYDTYVLEGGGSGIPWSLAHADTSSAGVEGCESYPCVKACATNTLTNALSAIGFSNMSPCEATYQEDGSFEEKVCIEGEGCALASYTEDGMEGYLCDESATYCPMYEKINADGQVTSFRECALEHLGTNGKCAIYDDGEEYTYDAEGRMLSWENCAGYDTNNNCSSFYNGYYYTYNDNGQNTSYRYCGEFNEQGNCSQYESGTDTTYDGNGHVTSYRSCNGYDGEDCISYESGNDYTYDGKGNQTSSRTCSGFKGDGSCDGYENITYKGYDENNNMTSWLDCWDVNDNGTCNQYHVGHEYAYDEQGHQIGQRSCWGWSGTTCNGWSSWSYY